MTISTHITNQQNQVIHQQPGALCRIHHPLHTHGAGGQFTFQLRGNAALAHLVCAQHLLIAAGRDGLHRHLERCATGPALCPEGELRLLRQLLLERNGNSAPGTTHDAQALLAGAALAVNLRVPGFRTQFAVLHLADGQRALAQFLKTFCVTRQPTGQHR